MGSRRGGWKMNRDRMTLAVFARNIGPADGILLNSPLTYIEEFSLVKNEVNAFDNGVRFEHM